MKNGLVLLLLMVALVAMTASAGAMAPVVGPLPAVIVGGAEDVPTPATADVHLLRYVNVFNLADPGVITRRTNPDDVSKLAVWYTVNGTDASTLKASTSASLVSAMTAAEATALTTVGTRNTAKQIKANTAANLWLSLIEDAPGAGKTHAATASTADVNANGASTAELASVVGKKTVALYAVDVDSVTTAVGTGSFDVYSLIASKDGLSPRTNCSTGANSGDGTSGWVFVQGLGQQSTASPASVGFKGIPSFANGAYQYSTWGRLITPDVNPTGMIYEVKATMTGSAAAAINTPGFRLFFIANLGVHSGGMQFMSKAGLNATTQNIPQTGSSKECRIYWAAPKGLTDMADGGFLGTKRAYGLQFDMIQEETTDFNNNIMMTAFNCDLIPRPVDIVPTKKWADGTNGSVTMAPNPAVSGSGWSVSPDTIGGYAAGFASVGDSNITLGMGSATGAAYKKVNLFGGDFATYPAWHSGQLIRTTYKVMSDAPSVPAFRLLTLYFGGSNLSQIMTIDNINFDVVRAANTPSVAHPILSGTPPLAGATIESYSYTHTSQELAGTFVFPQVDLVQANGSANNWNQWGKPGNLVINSIAMEVLKP